MSTGKQWLIGVLAVIVFFVILFYPYQPRQGACGVIQAWHPGTKGGDVVVRIVGTDRLVQVQVSFPAKRGDLVALTQWWNLHWTAAFTPGCD